MRKKIIYKISAAVIVGLFAYNLTTVTKSNPAGVALDSLIFRMQAQAEEGSSSCNGVECRDGNDLHYGTLTTQFGEVTCCGLAAIVAGKKSS